MVLCKPCMWSSTFLLQCIWCSIISLWYRSPEDFHCNRHRSHSWAVKRWGTVLLFYLYREGSLFSVSALTCCSIRLYKRIGREVKLILYSVRYAVSYKVCRWKRIKSTTFNLKLNLTLKLNPLHETWFKMNAWTSAGNQSYILSEWKQIPLTANWYRTQLSTCIPFTWRKKIS